LRCQASQASVRPFDLPKTVHIGCDMTMNLPHLQVEEEVMLSWTSVGAPMQKPLRTATVLSELSQQ